MENIIKELKEELLNKQMQFYKMDNKVMEIIKYELGIETGSIFDCDTRYALELGSLSYYTSDNDESIEVECRVIEENEDITEMIIEVTDIWFRQ